MAYRILFSGLMVVVEHHTPKTPAGVCDQVDVLLLNPCALHEDGAHKGKGGAHNHAASCTDLHEPQLMVKSGDTADWRLDGVLQGCGWHHFDLNQKRVFPTLGKHRPVQLSVPESEEFPVDPFGKMQHVSFRAGIVDLERVLGAPGSGRIDVGALTERIKRMIVAVVRLPSGELTALAPLANSVRSLLGWQIGNQELESLAEMVMFVPTDQNDRSIELAPLVVEAHDGAHDNDRVAMRRNPEVTVWITNEPLRPARTKGAELLKAEHFKHYYDLLAPGQVSAKLRASMEAGTLPTPVLQGAAQNIDNPLCPPCLMHSDDSLD